MKPKKHEIPRIPTAGEGNSLGQWESFFGEAKGQDRPRSRPTKSISRKREDAEMWAESVEKPKEPKPLLTVEPLLVSEETASDMLGIGTRSIWKLGETGVLQV